MIRSKRGDGSEEKMVLVAAVAAVLLVAAGVSVVPRVHTVVPVPVESLQSMPAIGALFEQLCAAYGAEQVVPEDEVQVVTVKNAWGEGKLDVLPCYVARTPDVPKAGNVGWNTALIVLSAWEEAPAFSTWLPLEVRDFSIRCVPGNKTVVSEYVDLSAYVPRRVNRAEVAIEAPVRCEGRTQIPAYYVVGTAEGAESRQQQRVQFAWQYQPVPGRWQIGVYPERCVVRDYSVGT